MDNLSNDNFGVEDVTKIVEGGKKLVASIKDNKRRKEAQALADAGEYWFLSPYAKKLIPIPNYVIQQTTGKGITQDAILNYPKQPKGTSFDVILPGLQLASGYVAPVNADTKAMEAAGQTLLNADGVNITTKIKQYMPYIIGAVVLGFIVYLISKK